MKNLQDAAGCRNKEFNKCNIDINSFLQMHKCSASFYSTFNPPS